MNETMRIRVATEFLCLVWKLAQEIPDDDTGVNCVRVIAYTKSWVWAWPYMAAITDTVMLDDTAVSALRPFQSRNIYLLEDDLAGWFTLVMSKPEV